MNLGTGKTLRYWFFELDASLRSVLFLGLELEDFHRFDQFFCVSFGYLGTEKLLGHWVFEWDASLRSVLFPVLELLNFHRFHQVFCVSFRN